MRGNNKDNYRRRALIFVGKLYFFLEPIGYLNYHEDFKLNSPLEI
jgi:hypothetical protein